MGQPKLLAALAITVPLLSLSLPAAAPAFKGDRRQQAIAAGLDWLVRHQHGDGHWSASGFMDNCKGGEKCRGVGRRNHDVGLTGLAVLALLKHGDVKLAEGPSSALKKGLEWLLAQQDAEGCFGQQVGEFMYDHAIA